MKIREIYMYIIILCLGVVFFLGGGGGEILEIEGSDAPNPSFLSSGALDLEYLHTKLETEND